MGAPVPPLRPMYDDHGKVYGWWADKPGEYRQFGYERDVRFWSPWTVFLAIVVLAWSSFCIGMWVGQIETLKRVHSAERVEAER